MQNSSGVASFRQWTAGKSHYCVGVLLDTSVRMLNGGEVGAILLVFMVLVLLTEMVSWLVRKVLA